MTSFLKFAMILAIVALGPATLKAAETRITLSSKEFPAPSDPTITYDFHESAHSYCGDAESRRFRMNREDAWGMIKGCGGGNFCHRRAWWRGWLAPKLDEHVLGQPAPPREPQSITTILPTGQGALVIRTFADGSHSVSNQSMGISRHYNATLNHLQLVSKIALEASK